MSNKFQGTIYGSDVVQHWYLEKGMEVTFESPNGTMYAFVANGSGYYRVELETFNRLQGGISHTMNIRAVDYELTARELAEVVYPLHHAETLTTTTIHNTDGPYTVSLPGNYVVSADASFDTSTRPSPLRGLDSMQLAVNSIHSTLMDAMIYGTGSMRVTTTDGDDTNE